MSLYSPKKSLNSTTEIAQFTDKEMKHFQKRFDERYDIPGNTRYYSQWWKMDRPECNIPHHLIPLVITILLL